jgi:hypothetical protein
MQHSNIWVPAVLALAVQAAWADEDEWEPVPVVPVAAVPVLPALGTFGRAGASGAAFRGCADYSMGTVWSEPDPLQPRVAVCDDTVYARDGRVLTTTTPGDRVSVGVSRPTSQQSPDAFTSTSANGWKDAGGAGATATANLLKNGNVLNLKVGAQAINARDAIFSITPTYDPWTAEQNGWAPGASNGRWRVEDGIFSAGAGGLARLADRFIVKGTGPVSMTFTVDGLYEKGDTLKGNAGGGHVSFAAGLFNPDSLKSMNLGGDTGEVRFWTQADFRGFALGRDARDNPFDGDGYFADAEELLGSRDFEVPGSSALPSAQLPDTPTPVSRDVTLTLDAVDGQELWLVAGLWAAANGWNPCDPVPGDGDVPNAATMSGPDDEGACGGRTVIDFTSTAKLTSLTLGGSITGLVGESGVDYRLAVASQPIPEPGTYALMLAGLAGVLGLAKRRRAVISA